MVNIRVQQLKGGINNRGVKQPKKRVKKSARTRDIRNYNTFFTQVSLGTGDFQGYWRKNHYHPNKKKHIKLKNIKGLELFRFIKKRGGLFTKYLLDKHLVRLVKFKGDIIKRFCEELKVLIKQFGFVETYDLQDLIIRFNKSIFEKNKIFLKGVKIRRLRIKKFICSYYYFCTNPQMLLNFIKKKVIIKIKQKWLELCILRKKLKINKAISKRKAIRRGFLLLSKEDRSDYLIYKGISNSIANSDLYLKRVTMGIFKFSCSKLVKGLRWLFRVVQLGFTKDGKIFFQKLEKKRRYIKGIFKTVKYVQIKEFFETLIGFNFSPLRKVLGHYLKRRKVRIRNKKVWVKFLQKRSLGITKRLCTTCHPLRLVLGSIEERERILKICNFTLNKDY